MKVRKISHLFRWAVDKKKCTLCPMNSSIGFDNVGGFKLTAVDIKKLNYAYHCDGNNKVDVILHYNQFTNLKKNHY